jgi:hypothetical protein
LIRPLRLLILTLTALTAMAARCVPPFLPQPDESAGLTNVSADLLAVLEGGSLPGSCDAYWASVDTGTASRVMELRCGKEMFFYEGFDTLGVPTPLVDYLIQNYPDEVGPGFSALGMIPDPTSPQQYPLGLAAGRHITPELETLAFTCASCHFGQLPDGRYSVGAPNHDYEYGRMNVALATFPFAATFGPAGRDPQAVAWLQPLLERLASDPGLLTALFQILVQLAPAIDLIPEITPAIENAWVHWKPGTMDFLMPPVPIDDGVHTISKIQALWGVPDARDVSAYWMESALLGFTGVSHSLESFLAGFVQLGVGDKAAWTGERLAPLAEYIYTLRAPENPDPPDRAVALYGNVLFYSEGCASCHRGARGASAVVHEFSDIGVDTAMKSWMDLELDGVPCCGFDFGDESLTQGIVSSRLVGLWAQKRFLHNGSVDTLEDLLCRNEPRPTLSGSPWSDQGHLFGCQLSSFQKDALIAFLLSK